MGTELMISCLQEEDVDFPSIPPGFGPFTSFTLKKVEDSANMICQPAPATAFGSHSTKMETDSVVNDYEKMTRALRRRPVIDYNLLQGGQHGQENFDKVCTLQNNISVRPSLPKGVIRGCSECSTCQKVTARWHPGDACKPDLDEAPVFHPSEEEFEDTLNYIASIRPIAEPYGICRIVPPPSWKPPCPLKELHVWESAKFSTRVQRVDKLQNRNSTKSSQPPDHTRKKRRRRMGAGPECSSGGDTFLASDEARLSDVDTFGFELGPQFTLDAFQKYADDFRTQYFMKNDCGVNSVGNMDPLKDQFDPSVEDIEGEYWRVVQKPTEEIEVLYGADLETGNFGSGFPKMSSQDSPAPLEQYIQSGWNLNKFPRLPGSVLSYESGDISGVLVPWLYIGMCFSSFCWHVEDHHLYSMNYLHWGAPKLWYGVPGKEASRLEATMRKHLPDLFKEQPDLLNKLVTQLSPAILKSEGVSVYRCIQNSGEFVLTFPRAYHSGFNCGFNCAEAVNVAPVDWLLHGQNAIELYRRQGRKTSISHDKLLLGAAREAVRAQWELSLLKKNTPDNLRWKGVCGKNGILTKALKRRVQVERTSRELHCSASQVLKMEDDFDSTTEKECSLCFFDLHLSAAGCHCSPDRFACLNHAKQLCSCSSADKYFLLRFDINELNILVEALEGKLGAVYRWARSDLGLALSSCRTNDMLKLPDQVFKLPQLPAGIETTPYTMKAPFNELKVKPMLEDINKVSTRIVGENICREKPAEFVLALEAPRELLTSRKWTRTKKIASNRSKSKKDGSALSKPHMRMPVCQLSREDVSYSASSVRVEENKPSLTQLQDVIILSDDEGKEPKKPSSDPPKPCHANQADFFERLVSSCDKTSLCNYNTNDIIPTAPVNTAAVLVETFVGLLPDGERGSHLSQEQLGRNRDQSEYCHQILSDDAGSTTGGFDTIVQKSSVRVNNNDLENFKKPQNLLPSYSGPSDNNGELRNTDLNNNTEFPGNVRTSIGTTAHTPNNMDRSVCQKGPRMAKLVRRISCNVEPLEIGTVLPGKLWCNSQVIFPKGYRSRVRYINISDPEEMSYYVSEILDGGRVGPLFMVSLENFPNEVFVHVTATRCWEMVRERVNQEISKQHKLGKKKLPPLQPPGSLDGIEMFGFSSPAIVQAIEAMDRNRVCTEYWNSRPYSRFQVQFPEIYRSMAAGSSNLCTASTRSNDTEAPDKHRSRTGTDSALTGLLKKASPVELRSLCSLLTKDTSTTNRGLLTRLLNEVIEKRL